MLLGLAWLPLRLLGVVARRQRVGRCVACHTTVFRDDAYVRYRGELYHTDPCVKISPYGAREIPPV